MKTVLAAAVAVVVAAAAAAHAAPQRSGSAPVYIFETSDPACQVATLVSTGGPML